jgi:S-adenosylmethionine decarboxylase
VFNGHSKKKEQGKMKFGIHFLMDGYGADMQRLADKNGLLNLLDTLPGSIGMHAITDPVVVEVGPNNKKDPGGISGFVMVAESHISVHTFPRRGFVTIDVYTCADTLDTDALAQAFANQFSVADYDTTTIDRGVRYPPEDC